MYTKGKWEVKYYHQYGNRRAGEEITPDIMCNQERVASVCIYAAAKGNQETADANAKRIVQCVNGWDELQKQRDALLEACKDMSSACRDFCNRNLTANQCNALVSINQAIQENQNE